MVGPDADLSLQTSTPAAAPAVETPEAITSPGITFSGPSGCVTAGTGALEWLLGVADAGAAGAHLVALTHHDGAPGCAATLANPRDRVVVTGPRDYAPHASGQTRFVLDQAGFECGRVQVDISTFDNIGHETLLVGMVINYGGACRESVPPPTSLACAPASQTASTNESVAFTVSGGTGPYTWSAPGSASPSGSGTTFATSYASAGSKTVTVTNGSATATCQVIVTTPPAALTCTPASQSVLTGQNAAMTASGGTGSYSWSAPGASATTGSGTSFATSYAAAGTHTVTLTSGSTSTTCQVVVSAPAALACAPALQSAATGQTVTMTASGGSGGYTWSAPGASASSGSGPSFSTSFSSSSVGLRTVTLTSGTATATCQVNVTLPTLTCTPTSQVVGLGNTATMTAAGGTGVYTWSAPTGSPTTGSGSTFAPSINTVGSNQVTVTSGSQTAVCNVDVPVPNESCTGVTASIVTPMTQPTGYVQVTIPANQQANLSIESWNHSNNTGAVYNFPRTPLSTTFSIPLACWPKLVVRCNGGDPPMVGPLIGTDTCP